MRGMLFQNYGIKLLKSQPVEIEIDYVMLRYKFIALNLIQERVFIPYINFLLFWHKPGGF